ncbi:hypothetical protein C427_5194 [Paraglaciecola psychrophila 170]|uniref:Uncharacterized protein n=1 Tax=Paraglaciecola psychrophila 170 TaxID=1129794 RepID=K6ZZL7_9ALTE|nr:hypothetical protein C427_5194 [Paraglaciecola psychrophila 170]GAC35652.1 hypothetical protein GPSY_0002 [Paraglaciecola psychrophila 170]
MYVDLGKFIPVDIYLCNLQIGIEYGLKQLASSFTNFIKH